MKSKISESSYVIDFLGIGYDSKRIKNTLTKELNKYLRKVEIPSGLDEWTLEFSLLFNNVKTLGIARKTKSVKSLKLKEVIIHIPIPKKEIISWGVNENQLIREIRFDKRYVDELKIEFHKYSNRTDYIIDNANRAIYFALESGVTINRKRLEMKK